MSSEKKSIHHSFDLDLAQKYGIPEAIIIHHFQHWISVNRKLKRNFHEGRTWTYQTFEEISAHFPYWTPDQVRDLLEKMTAGKNRKSKNRAYEPILMKGNFNENKYDRTVWYAFVEESDFIDIRGNPQMEKGESPKGLGEIPEPIPDNIPDDIPDKSAKAHSSDQSVPDRPKPSEIKFNFSIDRFENIETRDIESWKALYPTADIDRELKAMTEWIKCNPQKARSKKRWRQFITNWLRKTNEDNINREAFRNRSFQSNQPDRRPTDEFGNVKPSQYAGVFQ